MDTGHRCRSSALRWRGFLPGRRATNASNWPERRSTAGRLTASCASAQRTALHYTIEECRQSMKRGQRDVLAASLQAAGERAGDAAAAPRAGDREGDLRAVEPGDQAVRELDRPARSPGLPQRTAHHRPVADQVALGAVQLEGFDPALAGDIEMVGASQPLLEADGLAARLAHHLLVRHQETDRLLLDRLRHHHDGDRAVQAVVEEAEEAVAHPEELVRRMPGHRHLDARLEPLPEVLKIHAHDHQSSESASEGYSASPAK